MPALLDARLVALYLRRALHPGLVLPVAGLAALFACIEWDPGFGLEEAVPERVVRGLARQAVWFGSLAFLLPALWLFAARVVPLWRRRDAAWLAPRRAGAMVLFGSSWSGAALSGALVLGGVALASELAAGGDSPTWREAGAMRGLEAGAVEEDGDQGWSSDGVQLDWPAGSRLRLAFDLRRIAGAGTDIRLRATSIGPDGEPRHTEHAGRFAGATELELELPPGPGALEIELRREGSKSNLPPGEAQLVLLLPEAAERVGAWRLWQRTALLAAAGAALALGLGAWMSSPSAALLTLLLIAAPGLCSEDLGRFSPGAGLLAGFEALGRGLAPAGLGVEPVWGAAVCVIAGLGLARAGLWSPGGAS